MHREFHPTAPPQPSQADAQDERDESARWNAEDNAAFDWRVSGCSVTCHVPFVFRFVSFDSSSSSRLRMGYCRTPPAAAASPPPLSAIGFGGPSHAPHPPSPVKASRADGDQRLKKPSPPPPPPPPPPAKKQTLQGRSLPRRGCGK